MSLQPKPELAVRHKITHDAIEQQAGGAIATALEQLIEPPADAVSIFEQPGGWRVEAYFSTEPNAEALAAEIAGLLDITPPQLTRDAVPQENWVAISQAALPPVIAGRFTIHGSHDAGRVPRGPNTILIDAGEAFGTAHHATTAGCLMAIDRLARLRPYRRVLDLGCGSGVLAIAAHRAAPRATVAGSDIDPVAIDVARANARVNGAAGLSFAVCDGVPRHIRGARLAQFDLLIANILARPLVALAPAIAARVAAGGTLVLSGLLTTQSREVLGAYLPRGFAVDRHLKLAGWSTLTLQRRP